MKLSYLFSDGMVLQRGKRNYIWGETSPEIIVTGILDGRKFNTKADTHGMFVAELPEEYVDEISGDSVITLHGKNMSGIQEDYELSSATVSGNDGSETDASGGCRLTADIPGDLYPVGTKITVTVDNRSDTFDCCLPLSSLHQKGSSQYFIYVMEKEDAVMGTELTAKEVPVTVLDMNEQYVAVDEMISGDVIVSSDKDITDGSRVRLEEE